jgi:hypothetical protein
MIFSVEFIVTDLRKPDFLQLRKIFCDHLEIFLESNKIPKPVVDSILKEYTDSVEFSTTTSRSVLGFLNDLIAIYKIYFLPEGGMDASISKKVINKLNHMPMSPLKYNYSIEAFNKLLGL